jgi:pheromone shutdown protein TraB
MITLIGTGHVFDLSSAVVKILDEKNPDVVCVELDKQRYNALQMRASSPEKYRNNRKDLPLVYRMLSRFQDSMASEYGVSAGDEMVTAINYAGSHQIPVEFIDMNAQYLFTKMLKSMKLSEKLRLFLSGIGGFFVSKKRVEKELSRFEQDFDSYIEQIGEKFPTIKQVLIDDRNSYMVQQLVDLSKKNERVVAVMGDGHVPGVSELLKSKDVEFEMIRLRELRSQRPSSSDPTSASFTLNYKEP